MIDVETKIKEIEPRFIAICSARNLNANEQEFVKALAKTSLHVALLLILKSLWHDASKEPEKGKPCLVYGVFTCDDKEPIEDYFVSYFTTYGWTEDYFPEDYDYTIKRWCYIDELLPTEGGEVC